MPSPLPRRLPLDQPPASLLIVKPSSLGDVVHTLPALSALHHAWPTCQISWLVNPEWAPLIADHPFLHEVIPFPRKQFRGPLGFARFLAFVGSLRSRCKPDLVLDFQGLLRSGIVCAGVGGLSVGLSDSREGSRLFHRIRVPVPRRGKPPHAVERYLTLCASLGVPVSDTVTHSILPEGQPPAGFDTETPFVVVHPFSRGQGKSLGLHEIKSICSALAPWRVVIAGRTNDPCPPLESPVENWLNRTTLPELCWLLRTARWVVSVDSGPLHIAAAINSRLLAVHHWSDPALVGPWNPHAWVWKDDTLSQRATNQSQPLRKSEIGLWLRSRLNELSV